jgi:hypothetical protein
MIGSAAARGSRSSPETSSRLISSATTKKKKAMAPSLTHSRRVSPDNASKGPTAKVTGVSQKCS